MHAPARPPDQDRQRDGKEAAPAHAKSWDRVSFFPLPGRRGVSLCAWRLLLLLRGWGPAPFLATAVRLHALLCACVACVVCGVRGCGSVGWAKGSWGFGRARLLKPGARLARGKARGKRERERERRPFSAQNGEHPGRPGPTTRAGNEGGVGVSRGVGVPQTRVVVVEKQRFGDSHSPALFSDRVPRGDPLTPAQPLLFPPGRERHTAPVPTQHRQGKLFLPPPPLLTSP